MLRLLTGLRHLAGDSTNPVAGCGRRRYSAAYRWSAGHATLQSAEDGRCDLPRTEAPMIDGRRGIAEGGHRNHRWPPDQFRGDHVNAACCTGASRDADAVSHRRVVRNERSKRCRRRGVATVRVDSSWVRSDHITIPSFHNSPPMAVRPHAEVIAPAATACRVGSRFATAWWFRMFSAATPPGRAARQRSCWAAPTAAPGSRKAR